MKPGRRGLAVMLALRYLTVLKAELADPEYPSEPTAEPELTPEPEPEPAAPAAAATAANGNGHVEPAVAALAERTGDYCTKPFVPKDPAHRFCSSLCRECDQADGREAKQRGMSRRELRAGPAHALRA